MKGSMSRPDLAFCFLPEASHDHRDDVDYTGMHRHWYRRIISKQTDLDPEGLFGLQFKLSSKLLKNLPQ
jgi:hypothetical protein